MQVACPLCIIHGPFGSGKTQLLVAIISFLAQQMEVHGHADARILVAAHTNTAVDRVLVGLLDRGFTGMPVQKYPFVVLTYSLTP